MTEVWKSAAGYEGLYEVSSLGRLRTLHFKAPKVLSTAYLNKDGYPMVALTDGNGVRSSYLLHRIVCTAFHGPAPADRHEVDHIDFVRSNAAAENLRWVSRSENRARVSRPGGKVGESHHRARLTECDVIEIRSAPDQVKNAALAAEYGVSIGTIFDARSGRTWKHLTQRNVK